MTPDADYESATYRYECLACWDEDGEDFATDDELQMRRHQYNEHSLNDIMRAAIEVTK